MENGFSASPTPGLTIDEYNMGNQFVKDNYKYGTCVAAHTVAGAAIGNVSGANDRYNKTIVGAGAGFIRGTEKCDSNGGGCNII